MQNASPAALAVYFGSAAVSGVIVGSGWLGFPLDIAVLVVIAIGATLLRQRAAGVDSFGSSVTWLGVFGVTWIAVTLLVGSAPF